MPPRKDGDYMEVDSNSDAFLSDDDLYEDTTNKKGKGKSSSKKGKDKGKSKLAEQPYAWEASYTRSWETVQEDEGGSLQTTVDGILVRGRRRRLGPTTAIRRTIIRHLILILDLSAAMSDRDMRPTRLDVTLEYSRAFVTEWFDQNPLGQIGVVCMRNGLGERIVEMSGNPQDILKVLSDRTKLGPSGDPSLQNSIELAKGSMSHLPAHSSREMVLIFGSLTSVDPGNIHDTLESCIKEKIRVNVVALAAEMKICRDFCDKTGGQFGVAMDEVHFKDLLFELIPPPAQRPAARTGSGGASNPTADLMMMGFPTRIPETTAPALCVCHSELKSAGFLCPRCSAKMCDVPTDCDICGLMIVSSPHLARSYHHLFPVKPYVAVMDMSKASSSPTCDGCALVFIKTPLTPNKPLADGISPLGRYKCPECSNDFCSDCDVFVHDVVHCCPGCGR